MALGPGRSPGQRLWASGSTLVRWAGCEQEILSCGLGSKTDKQGESDEHRGSSGTCWVPGTQKRKLIPWRRRLTLGGSGPQRQRPTGTKTHGQSNTWAKLPPEARVTPAPNTPTDTAQIGTEKGATVAQNAGATLLWEQLHQPKGRAPAEGLASQCQRGHPGRTGSTPASAPRQAPSVPLGCPAWQNMALQPGRLRIGFSFSALKPATATKPLHLIFLFFK